MHPTPLRATIKPRPGGLQITIPAKKNWSVLIFMSLWLCMWTGAEADVGGKAVFGHPSPFELIWLCAWTIGGMWALYGFLWQLIGREEILATPLELSHRYRVLVWFGKRDYAWKSIVDLRYSAACAEKPYSGNLVFDYGAETHRFGVQVDEAEGKQILEALKSAGPQSVQ